MLRNNWIVYVVSLLLAGCLQDPVQRGMESLALGDYSMAREFFNEELKKNPRHFDARAGMGKTYIQQAWNESVDTALLRKALVHLEAARSIDSRPWLEHLLAETWLLFAHEKVRAGDTLSALTALTFALDHEPRNPQALSLSGALYAGYGYTHRADSLLTQSLQIDSTDRMVLFNLGMLHWHRQEWQDAARFWERCLALDTTDLEARLWLARAREHPAVSTEELP